MSGTDFRLPTMSVRRRASLGSGKGHCDSFSRPKNKKHQIHVCLTSAMAHGIIQAECTCQGQVVLFLLGIGCRPPYLCFGGNWARAKPEPNQNEARTAPELSQNQTRTKPELSQNQTRTKPELSQDHAGTKPELGQNEARTKPELSQN